MGLNQYGGMLEDADRGSPACAASAASRLIGKIDATITAGSHWDDTLQRIVGPFQGWLEGAHVTLIFAAALRIGGQNRITSALDDRLRAVRDFFLQAGGLGALDPGCGFAGGRWVSGNTCMDDYTGAADAYGWIAGYEYQAGRVSTAQTAAGLAQQASNWALSAAESVCVFNPDRGLDPSSGPCNAQIAELRSNPRVMTVSLNHGFENISYGLGLMPLIAGSHLGLRVAASGLSFGSDAITVAQALFSEAQQASDVNGSTFLSVCHQFPSYERNHYCADGMPQDCSSRPATQYACPTMYPVNFFYYNHIGLPNYSPYQFQLKGDVFRENDLCAVMGLGRRQLFQTLAYDWFVSTPALRANYEGFLDAADCQYIAGWAWDSTQPNSPINVDIYNGSTLLTTIAADAFRQDLLNAGKGNGYHAFWWPVSQSLKDGQPHSITVNFGGTGTPLANTPRIITCASQNTIQVVSGTYGGNCGAPYGNATWHLAPSCNGLMACQYTVSVSILGDPVPFCPKDYVAQWQCGTNPTVYQAYAPPEAGWNSIVSLSCN